MKRKTAPRIKELLTPSPPLGDVVVEGWVRSKRAGKHHGFLMINDGSSVASLQVFFDKEKKTELLPHLDKVTTGACVRIRGVLVASPGQGQTVEVQADSLEILGPCPEGYPLQKKKHSFEFLRDVSHLRARTNTIAAVARIRSAASFAIHRFFNERGFVYLHTPIITVSDGEGAGQMFQVTTLPFDTADAPTDYKKDFFGQKTFLTVTGQLAGETYATALKDIYTFGPTFRAENSNTTRHLAEFWMIEPEMAFCNLHGNMEIAENFLKYVISYLLEHHADDMAFFDKWIKKGIVESLTHVVQSDFTHVPYTEAVSRLEKAPVSFTFPVSWGIDLASEHERYLTETVFQGPIIVTDYPKEIKAFYMKSNKDGKTVRAMDVLVPQLGEVIGGSEREEDLEHLSCRMKEMSLVEEHYQYYLDLRRFGTVPHSGFGLGLERFIQYVTGMVNIRDVIPFPRFPGHCAL